MSSATPMKASLHDKDRFIMDASPASLIEGMLIAGIVTGAKRGILYIRHEYHLQERNPWRRDRPLRRAGLLGKKILGSEFDFELEVFVSPAAISAARKPRAGGIEGHRAEPAQQTSVSCASGSAGRSPRCSITSRLSSTCRKFWRGVSIGSPRRA